MSNEFTYNLGFLISLIGTLGLAFGDHIGGIGLGMFTFCMLLGYLDNSNPKN